MFKYLENYYVEYTKKTTYVSMGMFCIKVYKQNSYLYKPTQIISNTILNSKEKQDLTTKLIRQECSQKDIAKQIICLLKQLVR